MYQTKYSIAKDVTYYKQSLPDSPHNGHQFALLEITPEPGYYVTSVVITCANNPTNQGSWEWTWNDKLLGGGNAYEHCKTFLNGDAFKSDFGVADGSKVSLVLDSENFSHHGTVAGKFFIMIHTEPIPSPLYVEYDAGTIMDATDAFNGTDWLGTSTTAAGDNITRTNLYDTLIRVDNANKWSEGELTYTVAGITPEALKAAEDAGYQFVGWELEYYGGANVNGDGVAFSEPYGGFDTEAGATFELARHAKLTAQWKKVKLSAEVTKKVAGLDDNTTRTFTFTVKDANNKPAAFSVITIKEIIVNGKKVTQISEEKIADGKFTISVAGNGEASYKLYNMAAGTYTVTEEKPDDVTSVVGNGAQFTVADGQAAQHVTITNNYSTAPTVYTLTLIKQNPSGGKLTGAEFTLSGPGMDEPVVISSFDTVTGTVELTDVTLTPGETYTLTETKAPNGYNLLAQPITFSVDENGNVTITPEAPKNDGEEPAPDAFAYGSFQYVDGVLTLTVINESGYELPSTGGPGTTPLYALSGVLLLAAALLWYKHSSRKGGADSQA